MKKMLIVATVVSMIEWFNKDLINTLLDSGEYEIEVAVNLGYLYDTDKKRTNSFIESMEARGVIFRNIPFTRSPFSAKLFSNYKLLKELINKGKYDIIHCHTPVAGMLTRAAAKSARKKYGTKVVYTAHGFHFFKGSSKLSWLTFYPVEKHYAKYTDLLITINQEDFNRAKTFTAKKCCYLPGVGVDLSRFDLPDDTREIKRNELNLPLDATVIIHIAELNKNKNQENLLRAFSSLNNKNAYLLFCGKGDLEEYLKNLTKELGIENNVIFAGFRNDIPELLKASDIFAFPSYREGLPVSVIEAMASGLAVVGSKIRGISDLVKDNEGGFLINPASSDDIADKLDKLISDNELCKNFGEFNKNEASKYSRDIVLSELTKLYKELLG